MYKIKTDINDLEYRVSVLESLINEDVDEGVIRKVGDKWKILKKNGKDYWDADYDTKIDAQAALKAYWANKRECLNCSRIIVLEGFLSGTGSTLIRKTLTYLIKIFGHTLYFDHVTDKSAELFYKGKVVAELFYNDADNEIVVMPTDTVLAPVSFYDTSEYEIKEYLSDLILGDLNPEYA
jgi:hypothetical protein